MPSKTAKDPSSLTEYDIHLIKEGSHFRLYEKMGAIPMNRGVRFSVWAPNAKSVSVIGDFNDWDELADPLKLRKDDSGIWEGTASKAKKGSLYKYHIVSQFNDYVVDKADPYARYAQTAPNTASVVHREDYAWDDGVWMKRRKEVNNIDAPMSIYEVHVGSWRRDPGTGGFLDYREFGMQMAEYLGEMGFTHVELLPIMEHPLYKSWGYQTLGYFAPTSRFGKPEDLKFAIDHLHKKGFGVILDWVPSHFPSDEHGLTYFDGTHLYEHADTRKGFHPDWKSLIFNYGRNEVKNFLISSANFWLEEFHADGLRVDAVASMLYLDYSRKEGEWIPNEYGGRENIEAIEFLKRLNSEVYSNHPDVMTIAEESTAWPMVSWPIHVGGLGFGMKWDMGWMHDSLKYFEFDPLFRSHHHNMLTFRSLYSYTENYVLPLSHDEVVHGKKSLINKMPGDDWQRFANLRALFGYMYAQPGKKLIFQGGEIAQWNEWYEEEGLDWPALHYPKNRGLNTWIKDLNRYYKNEPALHSSDCRKGGFEWIDCNDNEKSILTFLRTGSEGDTVLVVCNFTPMPRFNYRVGVPYEGNWKEVLNSDSEYYGGSGVGNGGGVLAIPWEWQDRPASMFLTLPPLSVSFFKYRGG